jgi:hypothetical protein
MPRIVWVNASNTKQLYVTALVNDPNVPAGYVLTNTSDGSAQIADAVHDQDLQVFVGGLNSLCPDMRLAANANAIPTSFYVGDPTQDTVAANLKAAGAKNLWINGILGGGTGDK